MSENTQEEKPYVQGDSLTTLGIPEPESEPVLGLEPEPEPEPEPDREQEKETSDTELVATEPLESAAKVENDLGETEIVEEPKVESTEVPTETSPLSSDKKSRKRKGTSLASSSDKKKRKSKKARTDSSTEIHHNTLKKIEKLEREMKRLSLKVNRIRKHMPRCMR